MICSTTGLRARSGIMYSTSGLRANNGIIYSSSGLRARSGIIYSTSGLRARSGIIYSTSGLRANSGISSVPLVNTVPHGSQTETVWAKRRALNSAQDPLFHHSTQYCMVVLSKACRETGRDWTLYSTSQHNATWWSDLKPLRK